MQINFDELPDRSKVWIYLAEREFSENEVSLIEKDASAFTSTWESHGKPLKAGFKIFFHQFILIAVDESYYSASGCSIDKSVELIRNLEEKLGIHLLDRSLVAYLNGGKIQTTKLSELKETVKSGKITADTIVFDNTVNVVAQLQAKWQVPANQTWISRYFPTYA